MMPGKKLQHSMITYRQAEPSDFNRASRLLFDTFPKKATFTIGLGDENRARKILANGFQTAEHRLSYSVTEMVLYEGKPVGLVTAFPGSKMSRLNRRYYKLLLSQYGLRGKAALILRGLPLIFMKETAKDEYYLNNLAVKKSFRNRSVGSKILAHVGDRARGEGFSKIALMVAIENQAARRFYERHGFTVKAVQLESNKRVPYLGPGYMRMVKLLDK